MFGSIDSVVAAGEAEGGVEEVEKGNIEAVAFPKRLPNFHHVEHKVPAAAAAIGSGDGAAG